MLPEPTKTALENADPMPCQSCIRASEDTLPRLSQWSFMALAKVTGDTGTGLYEDTETRLTVDIHGSVDGGI